MTVTRPFWSKNRHNWCTLQSCSKDCLATTATCSFSKICQYRRIPSPPRYSQGPFGVVQPHSAPKTASKNHKTQSHSVLTLFPKHHLLELIWRKKVNQHNTMTISTLNQSRRILWLIVLKVAKRSSKAMTDLHPSSSSYTILLMLDIIQKLDQYHFCSIQIWILTEKDPDNLSEPFYGSCA